MSDLNDNYSSKEFREKWGLMYRPEREIPIASAIQRYEQFKTFWNDLDSLAKSFS